MEVNLDEAKTNLSQLIERAMAGEEIIIVKAGKPMVRLASLEFAPKRILGSAEDTISYSEGWDSVTSDEEISALLIETTSELLSDSPAILSEARVVDLISA